MEISILVRMELEDCHFKVIVQLLSTSKVENLFVGNKIGSHGISAFAQQLPMIPHLKKVGLDGNSWQLIRQQRVDFCPALAHGMAENVCKQDSPTTERFFRDEDPCLVHYTYSILASAIPTAVEIPKEIMRTTIRHTYSPSTARTWTVFGGTMPTRGGHSYVAFPGKGTSRPIIIEDYKILRYCRL